MNVIQVEKNIDFNQKDTNEISYLFEDMLNLIKEDNTKSVSNKVEQILEQIFTKKCLTSFEKNNYIKDIYKSIFYFSPQNINVSISIICGFINFGKQNTGKKYKPMIDYFLMESFNLLLKQCGWYIIKPIMNMLYNNIYKFQNETLFRYISNKIMNQLIIDIMNMNELKNNIISDICYHVPREKSFSFGWYSYYIACELYENKNYYKQQLKQTRIRHYLMNYRKIINELRNNTIVEISSYNQQKNILDTSLTYIALSSELKTDKYNYIDEIVDIILQSPKKELIESVLIEDEQIQIAQKENTKNDQATTTTKNDQDTTTTKNDQDTTTTIGENKWFSGWFSAWV